MSGRIDTVSTQHLMALLRSPTTRIWKKPLGGLRRLIRQTRLWPRSSRWPSRSAALVSHEAQLADHLDRRTDLILQSAGDGIYGIDEQGRGTFVNPAGAQMLGWDAENLLGKLQHDSVHHTRPDGTPYPVEECPIFSALREGATRQVDDEVFWRADGTSFPVEYISTPIFEDGRIAGAVVTFRDITHRRRAEAAEREVLRLTEAEEAQRHVIQQLQDALCPPLPVLEGAELGLCYVPAELGAPTGGDLYDLQHLPDGDLHLLVVDVIGKGLAGTKDALAVIHIVRSLVLQGHPLERIVERADELIAAQDSDLVATVVVGRYRSETGLLRVAGGGHPPPLLIDVDGDTRYLEANGRVIGWPEAGSDAVVEVVLSPGDTVVFYTDGLVESTKNIIEGLSALERVSAELRALPAAQQAREVVERMLAEATRRDDTLALVLRKEG